MSKVKCYSVRLESMITVSEKCYKAIAFDGSTALIPKSQVFGKDHDVEKSDAYWISAWILGQKEIQYSTKKVSFFDKDRAEFISETGVEIEIHIPEEKECVETEPIAELVKELTTTDIFKANKVLTLEKAKNLIGKRLACTSPEYKANTPRNSEFVLDAIITEWDDAATREYPDQKGKYTQYSNYQEYWASYFSEEKIHNSKNTFLLKSDTQTYYKCEIGNGYFSEPTFFGSDDDREVYFIEL